MHPWRTHHRRVRGEREVDWRIKGPGNERGGNRRELAKRRGSRGDGRGNDDARAVAVALAASGSMRVSGTGRLGTGTILASVAMEDTLDPTFMLGGMAEDRAEDEQGEGQEETAGLPGHPITVAVRRQEAREMWVSP